MAGAGMPAPWSLQDPVLGKIFKGLDLDSLGLAVKITDPIFIDGPLTIAGSAGEDIS